MDVQAGGGSLTCSVSALIILNTFNQPKTLGAALDEMHAQVKGAESWMDLTSTIINFYQTGILIREDQVKPSLNTHPYGFDSAWIHTAMLNDRIRTSKFFEGIREVVRPGDVVLDIGTGTGVLAIAAARAGARHVYAIECGEIGEAAKSIFQANGLSERITLLKGWSSQITLPLRADVLVTETIGDDPLSERIVETIIDARKRLLKPEARLIPSTLKIFGLPVSIPEAELAKRTFAVEALKNWRAWYDIDFDPLQDVIRGLPQTFYIRSPKKVPWKTLSPPVLLASIDFSAVKAPMVQTSVNGMANATGEISGVIVYFELELGPNTILSSNPPDADEFNSWRTMVWTFPESLPVTSGDGFTLTYRHRLPGVRDTLQVSPA